MKEFGRTAYEKMIYIIFYEIQERILIAYAQGFSKHAPNEAVPRIRMLWNSIPSQLTKENKKFIYGLIKDDLEWRNFLRILMDFIEHNTSLIFTGRHNI